MEKYTDIRTYTENSVYIRFLRCGIYDVLRSSQKCLYTSIYDTKRHSKRKLSKKKIRIFFFKIRIFLRMNYTLQELESLNALYKPKIQKEWHRYCWFIAKSVKNNNNMMCKYCKIVLKGAKSRFLEHLGGYGQDVMECPYNIGCQDFCQAVQEREDPKCNHKKEKNKCSNQ